MAIVTVRTPEPGVNDTVGAVTFVDGVAQVDEDLHAAELRYFRGAGYNVEQPEAAAPDEESKTTRGRRAASKDEEAAK